MEIKIAVEELRKRKLFVATPMYGGQCSGMFTRSCADLSALCTHYGIQLRFYFLFNESLITRARNYCADEFLRSGDSNLLFIDSDIGFNAQDVIALLAQQDPEDEDNQYDIIAGPYPKKCVQGSAKLITEDGLRTIASIVKERFSGKVLCYDPSTKKQTFRNVTNWWKEKNTIGKKWISLRTSKIRSRDVLTVTADHDVMFVENVLDPIVKYGRADSLLNKHIVVKPTKNSNRRYNALYNPAQLSVLIGSALGDGCLSTGAFMCVHGEKQTEYASHKADILNANIVKNRFTVTNAQTKALSELIGVGKTKTLKNVVHMLNEIALAYLYMDDGSLYDYQESYEENQSDNWWFNTETGKTKRGKRPQGNTWRLGRKANYVGPTCSIATMSFSVEDNQLLLDHLKNKFDIDGKILFQSPGKLGDMYPFIKFDQENTERFHKVIAPFVHPSLNYKLIEKHRTVKKVDISKKPLDFAAIKVEDIISLDDENSHLYDIEVDEIHNFFVNDVLVHNCISWEKIKAAVDKGIADKDPQVLEKYVGDYVFNPVEGVSEIPINQPVEVLEAGTGFMMIRRKTFEKFEKAYPKQKYRPDHIRTEHFDGSREIMAYFDTPIDEKKKRYLSEDYMFCQWSRKIGMKVWLCPWMQLNHVGMYVFGGSLADLAQIGVSATADPNQAIKRK